MNPEQYEAWLRGLVEERRLPRRDFDSLVRQRALFDENRDAIEAEFRGSIVGYANETRLIARSVAELLDRASMLPDPVYFEPIPVVPPRGGVV